MTGTPTTYFTVVVYEEQCQRGSVETRASLFDVILFVFLQTRFFAAEHHYALDSIIVVVFDSHRHVDSAIDHDHSIFAGAPRIGTVVHPEIGVIEIFYDKLAVKSNPTLEEDRSVYEETRFPKMP